MRQSCGSVSALLLLFLVLLGVSNRDMREVAFFCRRGRKFVINQCPGRWLRYLMCNLYKLGRRTFVFLNSATSLHFGCSSYIPTYNRSYSNSTHQQDGTTQLSSQVLLLHVVGIFDFTPLLRLMQHFQRARLLRMGYAEFALSWCSVQTFPF